MKVYIITCWSGDDYEGELYVLGVYDSRAKGEEEVINCKTQDEEDGVEDNKYYIDEYIVE